MAAPRLMALHINKSKTLAQCLQERTDYASNPKKTEKGELVTTYECDPMTVDEELISRLLATALKVQFRVRFPLSSMADNKYPKNRVLRL